MEAVGDRREAGGDYRGDEENAPASAQQPPRRPPLAPTGQNSAALVPSENRDTG